MAALVTLDQAKKHLGITTFDRDADIAMKSDQASWIILDFLKTRAHEAPTTVAITSSSVASPTVITTDYPHTFANGNTVVIAGHVDSVPPLNGSHVISGVTSTTFTVPFAVTTAGTGGTASIPWTVDTVPAHVKSAVLLMLTHLVEHRGDDMEHDEHLWQAIDRVLARSKRPTFA